MSLDDCNSTHCSYIYTDVRETDYCVSVEAVGCVNRTTTCRNISSRKSCWDSIFYCIINIYNVVTYMYVCIYMQTLDLASLINPRHTCARVTVLVLSVCLCVCVCS